MHYDKGPQTCREVIRPFEGTRSSRRFRPLAGLDEAPLCPRFPSRLAGGIGRSLAASGSDLFLRQPRPAKAFRISGYIFRAAKRDEFRNVGYA